jgi:hypothetical protein
MRDASREGARSTGAGGKGESITDAELREMYIHLGSIDGLTSVMLVHLLGRQT